MKFTETIRNIWKIEDLRKRLLITLLFVAVYRFGSFVVLPESILHSCKHCVRALVRAFWDYWICSPAVLLPTLRFCLGNHALYSASIVMQLLGIAVPYFQKLKHEAKADIRK